MKMGRTAPHNWLGANVLELYLSSASLQHLGIYPLLDKLKTAADSGIYGPAKVKEVVSLLRDELRATTHRHTERVHALCSLVHLAISGATRDDMCLLHDDVSAFASLTHMPVCRCPVVSGECDLRLLHRRVFVESAW